MLKKITSEINPEIRKILYNVSWLSFDTIFRLGISLFVGVWFARYFGPVEFGIWSYILAIIAILSPLTNLGLEKIVVRNLVREPKKINQILGSTFFLLVVSSLCTLIISIIIVFVLKPSNTLALKLTIIISSANIILAFNTVSYYFKAIVESKHYVWSKNISILIISIIKVFFILSGLSLTAFAVLNVVDAVIFSILIVYFFQKKKNSILDWKIDLHLAKRLLKNSWPLILSGLVILIYMRIDQLIIGFILGDKAVGLYSAAIKISELSYFIPMAIVSSFYPMLITQKSESELKYNDTLKKLYNLLALLGFVSCVILILFSNFIITFLFGQDYVESVHVLKIHLWINIFVYIGVASNSTFILIENYLKTALVISIVGAIVNIIFNLILIPQLGILGAALATLIAQFISFIIQPIFPYLRNNFIIQLKAIVFYDYFFKPIITYISKNNL